MSTDNVEALVVSTYSFLEHFKLILEQVQKFAHNLDNNKQELVAGTHHLPGKSIERILPGRWLNDDVINAVCHQFNAQAGYEHPRPRFIEISHL